MTVWLVLAGRAYAEPVQPATKRIMILVAHQDDDILITVPDLVEAVREGRTIQTVYLTSGDAGYTCDAYTHGRELGAKAQQARLAGVDNRWVDEERVILGKHVRFSRLLGTAQSMVFIGLPNPAFLSDAPPEGALMKLWQRELSELATLPYDGRSAVDRYTRAELIELLRALMNELGPEDVRMLDASQLQIPIYPFEHVDHMASAMFALAAFQRYARADALTFYPTYNIQFSPVNMSPEMIALRRHIFATYRAFDPKICSTLLTTVCGELTTCDPPAIYEPFFTRNYPADTVRRGAAQLRAPSGLCLEASGAGALRPALCDGQRASQRWSLERGGAVRNAASGQCLAAQSAEPGSVVTLEPCARAPRQQFYLTTLKQLRGPDATCVREGLAQLTLAACDGDARQLGFRAQ